MILDDLSVLLSGLGYGVPGKTLFMGIMEDQPDVCVSVYEYMGMAPEYIHDFIGVAYEAPRIQVACRGVREDYPGPRQQAQAIWLVLNGIQNTTINGVYYRSILALGSPILIERDALARVKISCNYQVHKAVQ